jgi:hypothetical protein
LRRNTLRYCGRTVMNIPNEGMVEPQPRGAPRKRGWRGGANCAFHSAAAAIVLLRSLMLNRRTLLIATIALALPASSRAQTAASAGDPTALLTRLYVQSTPAGGDFVNGSKSRAKYLTKSFAALWTKAEAKVPDGVEPPVDFDPVSNSQDPDIKSYAIAVEKQDAASATLAVTLTGSQPREKPDDSVIRYDLVRDGVQWRIDDIRGSIDGEPWSIRKLLTDSLKPKPRPARPPS